MRKAESPYLADLFAISLRWLALFGLTISLGTGGALSGSQFPLPLVVLILPALWNGYVSALAIYNRRLVFHRQINVTLDILFSLGLFVVTGELSGSIFWVALLPLFSGAVYFETRGAMLVALITSLFQAGTIYLTSSPFQWVPAAMVAGFNLGAGIIASLFSAPLLRRLRKTYQGTVTRRKEGEQKAKREEHDRMKTLFEMIETFSSTLNYQTVLETVLGSAVTALEGTGSGVHEMVGCVMLFGDMQQLEIHATTGFVSHDKAVMLPAEQGILEEAIKRGEALQVENPGSDPELGKMVTMQNQKIALCLPLVRSMNAYGIIVFAHATVDFFTPERVETLLMLSNQAVISLQNARLYQDLERDKERILQSQEEAQKKLARELHDGPTQSVSAIAMRISIARRILQKPQKDEAIQQANEELEKIEDLARRTTQEIRHMLFTLRPLVLESEGLDAALQTMAQKMQDLYQQKVTIETEPEAIDQLDANRQTALFHLAEEAANNARKHAQAAEIRVRIKVLPKDPCIAVLEVADNGVGFDVQEVMGGYSRRGSLGMINLQERTELVNGLLKVDSIPGKGTRICVFFPLNEQGADRLHQRR